MKLKLILAALFLTTSLAKGQGTFVYDQQSTNLIEGAAFLSSQPMGQSFTPIHSSVGFVMLDLYNGGPFAVGSTVYVNLRVNSIAGPILGSTTPVFIPNVFFGITNFLFSTAVPVTPGMTYYLQPAMQPGGTVGSYVTDGSYPGGTAIALGSPVPDRDLWFREGIVVPEPGTWALLLAGCGVLAWHRRKFR